MELNELASVAVQVSRHGRLVDKATIQSVHYANLMRSFEQNIDSRIEMSLRRLLEMYLLAEYRRVVHGKKVTRFVDWFYKLYGANGYILMTRKQIRSLSIKYAKADQDTRVYVIDVVNSFNGTLQLDGIVEIGAEIVHHGSIALLVRRSE